MNNQERTKSIETPADKGKAALKLLKENCADAFNVNSRLLTNILKTSENTEYGKKYDFSQISGVDEFKRTVPFSTYDTYEKAVKRMINGEKDILTGYPIVHYATTSGSVGVPKLIPVSDYTLSMYASYTSNVATALIDEYVNTNENRPLRNGKRFMTAIVASDHVPDGTTKGAISGCMYNKVRPLMEKVVASPPEVLYTDKKMNFKYLKSFYALKEPNITSITAPFSTAVLDLMHYIELNWEKLCHDIKVGILDPDVDIDEEYRVKFQSELAPDPDRASFLMSEFEKGFDDPIIPRIWPQIEYINAIGAGGFKIYTDKLRYFSGSVPMTFGNYAASEAMMAVVTEIESMEYTLIPQSCFYEFIPVDDSYNDDKSLMTKTLNIDELEIGKDYEIVITNTSGFYRYRIGDVISVVGYEGKSPKICFHFRKNQVISIEGEKTTEESIAYTVDSFSKETGVKISDFSIYADTSSKPGRYLMLMEPYKNQPKEKYESYRSILDKHLCFANPSYGSKVKDGILLPMEIAFVELETYALYREMLFYKGVSENQIKPVRVIDNPIKEKFFFGLIEKEDQEGNLYE